MRLPRLTEVFLFREAITARYDPERRKTDPDYDWVWEMNRSFWNSIPTAKRTWDKEYDSEARSSLSSMTQRLTEEMFWEYGTPLKKDQVKLHGHLALRRIPPDKLYQRGDFRYPSDELAEIIKGGKDLAPIAAGADSKNGPYRVLDGHHRTRAYQIAKKDALCFVGWVDTSGKPGEITFEVDV